jgi:hypothetical protein
MKVIYLIIGVILSSFVSNAQTSNDKLDILKTVVAPSPNASSLGKYGETPVSLYTGLPNINIPIYSLKTGNVSVPISLSYHAGGNKVGEIASWVGLGWSLNCGGIISRNIRGWPDEDLINGYFVKKQLYTNQNDLCSAPINANESKQHKVQAAKGETDAEQDLYSFNGLGKSFKFLIKDNGEIIPVPYNSVKITTNFHQIGGTNSNDVYWNVLFEDGTKLEFGSAGFIETNQSSRFDNGASYYVTSWLLRKVTVTNNEIVNFTYNSYLVNQDSYFSNSDQIKYASSVGVTSCNLYDNTPKFQSKGSMQTVLMLQVATIEDAFQKVEFVPDLNERQDLKGAKFLKEIKIYSKASSKYIDFFNFNYTYSDCVPSNEQWTQVSEADKAYYKKRLKLIGITRNDKQNWVMNYNPLKLPSRRSYAQDHWGYYNGKTTNNTLLPKYFFPLPTYVTSIHTNAGFNLPEHDEGADREGSGTFAKAELIESISYPTGGLSSFVFEANTIPTQEELFSNASKSLDINLTTTSSPFTTINTQNFTVTKAQNVKLTFNSTISSEIFNDRPNTNIIVQVINSATNTIVGGISTPNGSTQFSDTKYFNLLIPGDYSLKISTNALIESFSPSSSITASSYLYYEKSEGVQQINKNVGGIRLSKMIDFDGSNQMEKNYIYENPLVINPVDIQKNYFTETEEEVCNQISEGIPGIVLPTIIFCNNKVVTKNSTTKFSLGSVQGGTVGYGKVTVTKGVNGGNGKTITEFTNFPDNNLYLAQEFPYPPVESLDHRRGLVLSEIIYDVNNTMIEKTISDYEFITKADLDFFKAGIFQNFISNCPSTNVCTEPYGDCGIQKVCYNSKSEQIKSISKQQFSYSAGNILSTITNNYYDNPNNVNPTRIETTNSKGELLKTLIRTPLEKATINAITPLTPNASAAIDTMLARNIISPTLQTESYKGTTLLSRTLVNYKNWNPIIVQSENVQTQIGTAALKTKIKFNNYDNLGNLLEQQKVNDVVQCYIYGYNKQYPVAQVIGSTYMIASSFIDQSILDNPLTTDAQMRFELNKIRTGLAGTKALVTTYTYSPLIGITSQTDANNKTNYYEYDRFNRLNLVKDQDGNIVKKFCYKYDGQPEDCGIFYSIALSQYFTRNNCLSGETGSNVLYTVPAGQFSSTVSQADADQQAITYLNANGQTYANTNGSCTTSPSCVPSACAIQGEGYKCIDGVCKMGDQVFMGGYYDSILGQYVCIYHYEYSDGTWSQNYTFLSSTMCLYSF